MIGPGFAAHVGRIDLKRALKWASYVVGISLAAIISLTWGVAPT